MVQNSLVQPVESKVAVNNIVESAMNVLATVAKAVGTATVFIIKAPFIVLNGLLQADELEEARRRSFDTRQYSNVHRF